MWSFFTSSGQEKVKRGSDGVGTITAFGGASAPAGWLLCDGAQIAIASYPALAGVCGMRHGAHTNGSGGAGSTHFLLPDLRGRVAVGLGVGVGDDAIGVGAIIGGTALADVTTGTLFGAETVTLTEAQSDVVAHTHSLGNTSHTHTTAAVAHTHPINYLSGGGSYASGGAVTWTQPDGGGGSTFSTTSTAAAIDSATSGITLGTAAAVAANAHTNLQPFLVAAYIVKT